MESSPTPSPLLPWEVIERIISHSCDSAWHPEPVLNFSLTCRELRPRSLCLLVADTELYSRDKVFDFCDFLQAKPHLKPFVRSITVDPNDFAPVPLLHILPNLSEIKFMVPPAFDSDCIIPAVLNQSSLTCCQRLSTRIQTLCLSDLSFATSLQFFRVLSTFTSIAHLVCSDVLIKAEGDRAPLDVAKRRLSQRLRLLTLVVSYGPYCPPEHYYDRASVGTLLLDSGLVQSTVESLTVGRVYRSSGLPQQFNWSRLRSLTLELLSSESEEVADGLPVLKDFNHVTLKEVIVKMHERDFLSAIVYGALHAKLYEEFEHTLLKFSQARLVWIVDVLPMDRNSFWMQEVGKRFPALFQRGALAVVPDTVFRTGHMRTVVALIISPDSEWVASGSQDGTVILWNTANGAMVQQWVPHGVCAPVSLAFSSNSQYLVSGALWDGRVVIWDLGGDPHQVLEGHTRGITSCAWSPGGDMIASGSLDATVRLWDADTFQPLHVLEHAADSEITLVEFSPNGHWLLTGCFPGSYYIWDVVWGTGRQLRMPVIELPEFLVPTAAAFDPGSTRFVIPSPSGAVEILDTEGGEESHVVLGGAGGNPGWERGGAAFSPDGNLVLTVPNKRARTHAMTIWDAHTGIALFSLEGHEAEVLKACFSPCGKYVASASGDTVWLWSTNNGSCIATLSEHSDQWVTEVGFSPDGKTLVSGAEDGLVIIRQVCDVLPIEQRDP